ncbi:hypothetical protein VP01_1690g3 [Puccinia sorghi]|uniref:Polygalacturonase n=1 Tax=Puccinia sorghi TaxID=27349 RepID=A0A0L6VGE2_9BASI|nr:hypothetical protein VP01_1690g3 [Puccinia sorghi]
MFHGTEMHPYHHSVEIHNFRINCTTIGTTDGVDVSGKNMLVSIAPSFSDTDRNVNRCRCVTAKSPLDGLLVENIQCITTDGKSSHPPFFSPSLCKHPPALAIEPTYSWYFGREAKDYSIQNILYRNVSLTNASHGVSHLYPPVAMAAHELLAHDWMVLKSYASATGIVRNITYTDFTLVSSRCFFDYTWGDTLRPHKRAEGVQQWADATFVNFKGTGSNTRSLVTLNCPPSSPCYNFQVRPSPHSLPYSCPHSFNLVSCMYIRIGSLPACDPAARPQFLTSS